MYPIRLYLKHRTTFILLIFGGLLNLATWLWLAIQIKPQSDPIFLHYNILFGVDEIGPWSHIFFLPLGGLVILVANGVIGWLLFGDDKYKAHFLGIMAVIIQIFILIAAALLVALNV